MVTTSGVREWLGESGASAAERIPGRRKSYLEGEATIATAALQSRAGDPGRDRKTPRPQGATGGCVRRETRHDPGLVSTARSPEVRWLQAQAVSRPSCGFTRSGSLGGPNGARELRLG